MLYFGLIDEKIIHSEKEQLVQTDLQSYIPCICMILQWKVPDQLSRIF